MSSPTIWQRLTRLFMTWVEDDIYWTDKHVDTPGGLLAFLDALVGRVLETGFLLGAAWIVFQRHEGFHSGLAGLLVLLFAAKFFFSRRSVKVELTIGERLFGKLPEEWPGPKKPVGIIASVATWFALYMSLAWFSYNVYIVSAVMTLIACIDWNTRRLINKNMKRLFADDRYAARSEDASVVDARRAVVSNYLGKPHLWKEGACAAGCGTALAVAVLGHVYGGYAVLLATLLSNEIVTWHWRSERDRDLVEIEHRFATKK